MATGVARDNLLQTLMYIRKRVRYSDPGIAAGIRIGTMPKNAFIVVILWYKATAFNSQTSDTMQLGTTAGGNDILAATDVHSQGFVNHASAAGLGMGVTTTADQDVYLKWTGGGNPPSAGDVTVTLIYGTDHDN